MGAYRFLKRLFDVVSAALAIVVSSPLWLAIAVGIKLSSEGPVFYRADRVGRGAEPFTLYKFRSMHPYRPEVKGQGEQREGGYIANEDRIFPFGGFLRKSKLDEPFAVTTRRLGCANPIIGPPLITFAVVSSGTSPLKVS